MKKQTEMEKILSSITSDFGECDVAVEVDNKLVTLPKIKKEVERENNGSN